MDRAAYLRARILKADQVLAAGPDPDMAEWRAHCVDQLAQLEAAVAAVQTERAVRDAWQRIDDANSRRFAEDLAALIRQHGGPSTTRAWYKSGVGARVYFPGNAGWLGIHSDGSASNISRGRLTFQPSGLYPAWARAVKAALRAWTDAVPDRLAEIAEARVAAAAHIRGR